MTYSDALVPWLKRWEAAQGPFLEPHWDAIGQVWDIGYGHVLLPDEQNRRITPDEAEELLHWDMEATDTGVRELVKVKLLQQQWDAVVGFAYNEGLDIDDDPIAEGLGDSTLLRLLNAGQIDAAAAQFTLWVYAKGKFVQGLLNRRLSEQAMFVNGDYGL